MPRSFEHTVSVDNDVWAFFQKHFNMRNPARPMRDILRREMYALQTGAPPRRGFSDPVFEQGHQSEYDRTTHMGQLGPGLPLQEKKSNGLSPDLVELCEQLDVDPDIFDPDPTDSEPQFKHLKSKKHWLLRGYRCEGMQNPERSLSFIIGDIQARTSWDDLGEQGQAAYRAMTEKYRQWVFANRTAA